MLNYGKQISDGTTLKKHKNVSIFRILIVDIQLY